MPRDLTDLMERATSSAPPELHAAQDITRLAAHRQQRRTTGLAAAAAAVVVVASGLGYGLTRGHDTSPQPAGRDGRTVDVTAAVAASSLPGYRLEPWTVPSVQHLGSGVNPVPTYRQVDASGRLIVEDLPGADPQGPTRIRIYDAPGQAPRALKRPPTLGGFGGTRISWAPSFLSAGRLLWTPTAHVVRRAQQGFYLSDLGGGHRVFVHSGLRDGRTNLDGTPDFHNAYVDGGRMWFLALAKSDPATQAASATLYSATFAGALTKVADGVAALGVGDGTAAWVTTKGVVETEPSAGGRVRTVPTPLDPGCRVSSEVLQGQTAFAVSGSAVGLSETCGSGDELVAFDLSGRRLVRVTGSPAFNVSFAGHTLVFQGLESVFRYDLVTGTLSRLNAPTSSRFLEPPNGAGSYVLWYDGAGGHVAKIPD